MNSMLSAQQPDSHNYYHYPSTSYSDYAADEEDHEEADADNDANGSSMTDTIHVAYTDPNWSHSVQYLDEEKKDFLQHHARELSKHVSYMVPTGETQRYEKIIVIKDEDLQNLRTRIIELQKHEDCKLVNFGVFTSLPKSDVVDMFIKGAKSVIKTGSFNKVLGRIWSLELNGTGKGCGIIAGDEKIHVWKDK